MNRRFRIHVEIQEGQSPFKRWTFDHPQAVSVGYAPDSDLWLLDGNAKAKREVFSQHRGELRLRILPDLDGSVQIEKQDISLRTLQEMGLFKIDGRGEYLPLNTHTSGHLKFGESLLRFWVTPEPDEPDFPVHPAWLRLAKSIPVTFCLIFLLGLFVDLWFIRFLASLPPQPTLTIREVSKRVARISIPKKDYAEKKYGALGRPRQLKSKLESPEEPPSKGSGSAPAIQGFLAAAVSKNAGTTKSPFAALFTTESLAADLSAQMGAGSMEKLLSQSLRTLERSGPAGSGTNTAALGIGSIREEGLGKGSLGREASRPVISHLSATLPRTGSRVNRKSLEQTVASRQGELQTCYEQALNRNPQLSGKVVLEFRIAPDGKATNVKIAQSSMADAGFHRCLVRQVSSWVFPSTGSLTEPLTQPFVFSSSTRG